jgi:hypothetical protein
VKRALNVLTGGAFITLAAEVTDDPHPVRAIGAAAVFSLLATLGYAWIDRQSPRRRRWLAVGYVAVQLPLSFVVFGAGGFSKIFRN